MSGHCDDFRWSGVRFLTSVHLYYFRGINLGLFVALFGVSIGTLNRVGGYQCVRRVVVVVLDFL